RGSTEKGPYRRQRNRCRQWSYLPGLRTGGDIRQSECDQATTHCRCSPIDTRDDRSKAAFVDERLSDVDRKPKPRPSWHQWDQSPKAWNPPPLKPSPYSHNRAVSLGVSQTRCVAEPARRVIMRFIHWEPRHEVLASRP